jgi:TonB family protein
MSKTYGVTEAGFSPESERLIRLTLAYRGKPGAAARAAFLEAWRAEVARMQSAAWECPVLEKELAERDALIARTLPAEERSEAREAYLEGVARSMTRGWSMHEDHCREDGRGRDPVAVDVEIRLGRSGELKDVRVFRSSGSGRVDAWGLDAVRAARPFEPPPPSIVGSTGEIVFGTRFWCPGRQRGQADGPPAPTRP